MIDKPREVALKTLYKINKEGAYSNIALDETLSENKNKLTDKDIGLISEIVYGTITYKLSIDEIIKKYSSIKMKKISPWILNILRMGIYQIVFLDKIPKSAAVNESVNLAKRYGHKSSSNFVNAILRKVEKDDFEEFKNIKDNVERISKTTSMPIWIVEELLKEKTAQETEQICINSNIRPKVCIRVNKLKTSSKELKEKLEEENISFEDGIIEDFIVLNKVKNIENLDLFKQGLFTIQDEAAGLTALILNPKKGEKVLDACAAPGGKTTYLAEIMQNEGEIVAWDIYEHRINLVNKNATRLGINIIKTELQDATKLDKQYIEKFDKILLDVPCLGIGVIKRKPDIKWQRKSEDVEEISKIQKEILEKCTQYLKIGGELVYSTCSILEEENQNIIEEFLKENKNFKYTKYDLKDKEFFVKYLENSKYIKVYQNKKTDGFFIAKIQKT